MVDRLLLYRISAVHFFPVGPQLSVEIQSGYMDGQNFVIVTTSSQNLSVDDATLFAADFYPPLRDRLSEFFIAAGVINAPFVP